MLINLQKFFQLYVAVSQLRTYTGEKITVKGSLDVKVSYENQKAELTLALLRLEMKL